MNVLISHVPVSGMTELYSCIKKINRKEIRV